MWGRFSALYVIYILTQTFFTFFLSVWLYVCVYTYNIYNTNTLPQLVASPEIVHRRGTAPENSWINIKFVKKSPKVIDLIWVWFIIYIKPIQACIKNIYTYIFMCVIQSIAVFVRVVYVYKEYIVSFLLHSIDTSLNMSHQKLTKNSYSRILR